MCDNHVTSSKSSPEGILRAAGALKLLPQEVIYVRDSSSDMEAARAAGALAVGALWDQSANRANFETMPDHWANTPDELWQVFRITSSISGAT